MIASPTESHAAIALPLIAVRRAHADRKAGDADAGRSRRADCRGEGVRRRARGRSQRAIQSGGRGGAAVRQRSALHRSASPGHAARPQPRHRRRARPDDSRSRSDPEPGAERGRERRGRRRAGADAEGGHRERARAVQERLHRQPDGEPDQPGSDPQDSLLPARAVRVDRHARRARSRCISWCRSRAGCRRSTAAS